MSECVNCRNTAVLGGCYCRPCEAAIQNREYRTKLRDAVSDAAMDIPEGPFRRFADAVIEWIDESGIER